LWFTTAVFDWRGRGSNYLRFLFGGFRFKSWREKKSGMGFKIELV
jgi:hypothetical protein